MATGLSTGIRIVDGTTGVSAEVLAVDFQNHKVAKLLHRTPWRTVKVRQDSIITEQGFDILYYHDGPPGDGLQPYPARWLAVMLTATGDQRQPHNKGCDHCKRREGPFEHCITDSRGPFKKCGNCEWLQVPCSLFPASDKGVEHDAEMEIVAITPSTLEIKHDGDQYTEPSSIRGIPLAKIHPNHEYWVDDWAPFTAHPIRRKLSEHQEILNSLLREFNSSETLREQEKERVKHLMLLETIQMDQCKEALAFLKQGSFHPCQLVAKEFMVPEMTSLENISRLLSVLNELREYKENGTCAVEPEDWIRQRLHELIIENAGRPEKPNLIDLLYRLSGDDKLEDIRIANGKRPCVWSAPKRKRRLSNSGERTEVSAAERGATPGRISQHNETAQTSASIVGADQPVPMEISDAIPVRSLRASPAEVEVVAGPGRTMGLVVPTDQEDPTDIYDASPVRRFEATPEAASQTALMSERLLPIPADMHRMVLEDIARSSSKSLPQGFRTKLFLPPKERARQLKMKLPLVLVLWHLADSNISSPLSFEDLLSIRREILAAEAEIALDMSAHPKLHDQETSELLDSLKKQAAVITSMFDQVLRPKEGDLLPPNGAVVIDRLLADLSLPERSTPANPYRPFNQPRTSNDDGPAAASSNPKQASVVRLATSSIVVPTAGPSQHGQPARSGHTASPHVLVDTPSGLGGARDSVAPTVTRKLAQPVNGASNQKQGGPQAGYPNSTANITATEPSNAPRSSVTTTHEAPDASIKVEAPVVPIKVEAPAVPNKVEAPVVPVKIEAPVVPIKVEPSSPVREIIDLDPDSPRLGASNISPRTPVPEIIELDPDSPRPGASNIAPSLPVPNIIDLELDSPIPETTNVVPPARKITAVPAPIVPISRMGQMKSAAARSNASSIGKSPIPSPDAAQSLAQSGGFKVAPFTTKTIAPPTKVTPVPVPKTGMARPARSGLKTASQPQSQTPTPVPSTTQAGTSGPKKTAKKSKNKVPALDSSQKKEKATPTAARTTQCSATSRPFKETPVPVPIIPPHAGSMRTAAQSKKRNLDDSSKLFAGETDADYPGTSARSESSSLETDEQPKKKQKKEQSDSSKQSGTSKQRSTLKHRAETDASGQSGDEMDVDSDAPPKKMKKNKKADKSKYRAETDASGHSGDETDGTSDAPSKKRKRKKSSKSSQRVEDEETEPEIIDAPDTPPRKKKKSSDKPRLRIVEFADESELEIIGGPDTLPKKSEKSKRRAGETDAEPFGSPSKAEAVREAAETTLAAAAAAAKKDKKTGDTRQARSTAAGKVEVKDEATEDAVDVNQTLMHQSSFSSFMFTDDPDLEFEGYTDVDDFCGGELSVHDWALQCVKSRMFTSNPGVTQYWYYDNPEETFQHQVLRDFDTNRANWSHLAEPFSFNVTLDDVKSILWCPSPESLKIVIQMKDTEKRIEDDGQPRGDLVAAFARNRTKRRFIVFCQERGMNIVGVSK